MRLDGPQPVEGLIVRYSAGEIPNDAMERLQRENCDALIADEITPVAAFRVANLLLSIALMKLEAVSSSEQPSERELRAQLLTKLAAVQREVGVIEKDKRNEFHRYDYASIEAIVLGTREHLLEHGLIVLAGRRSLSERQRQTSQGEATVTTVDITFEVYDVETGFSLAIDWLGRGEDPADKGIAKALTDARKTFLIQQLNLARGEDTEADSSTDERSSGAAGTVNMVANARGLSDQKLNTVLVAVGLPAQQKPFGAFARIPSEARELVAAELEKAKAA